MNISGAIFDMDGTLTDSMFIWMELGSRYLVSYGITPRENLLEEIKALTMWDTIDYIKREYGIHQTNDEIYRRIESLLWPMYRDEVLPKDGVFLLLDRLRERGVKMAVASATDKHIVEMVLEKTGLLGYFSEVFTCSSVGAGKDVPLIYEKALDSLGTPKEETAVFEDALYALTTAKNAGFPVVGVYDASAEKDRSVIEELSDFYITDYKKDYLFF